MEIFSEKHKEILINIDQKMADRIDQLEIDTLCKIRLKQVWTEDSRSEELKSDLIWQKKENFLKKKRHSELQNGDTQICTKTWEEVLQERNKFKKKKTQEK